MKTYRNLLVRVEYPLERGYRMECKPLPPWIHFTITTENDSKVVTIYSKLHINKVVKLDPSYSIDFKDIDIIKDISGKISHMFL